MKFEFERSKLKNGDPVSFRFSEAEFPKFTWKGYVPLGQEHVNIFYHFYSILQEFFRSLLMNFELLFRKYFPWLNLRMVRKIRNIVKDDNY